jgi:hypothetical protein
MIHRSDWEATTGTTGHSSSTTRLPASAYTRAHMRGAHDRFKTSHLATAERAAGGERTPPV